MSCRIAVTVKAAVLSAAALLLMAPAGSAGVVHTGSQSTTRPAPVRAAAARPAVVLDPRTNDRSLVMTSSFTNLVLAARFLGSLRNPDSYRKECRALAAACQNLLLRDFGALAEIGSGDFDRVVYLTAGPDRGR